VRISNSELQTFKNCRRRWYLNYYLGYKKKQSSFVGPLALGSRIHRALELWYETDDELLDIHDKLIQEDTILEATSGGFVSGDLQAEAELGRIMLEGYLEWSADTGFDSDIEVISNEQIISVPMLNGQVELIGKLDQRVRRKSDGARLIRDWKTAADIGGLAKTAHMNEQLLTYLVIEAMAYSEEERCDGGLFVVLKKVKRTAAAKPPFYDVIEVRHNIFALRSFYIRVEGVLRDLMAVRAALDAGADHRSVVYPRPDRNCTWMCEFYPICPLFDDGSAAENALTEMFEQRDPYDYYHMDEVDGQKGSA
jgi:hypothetical protein